MRTLGVLLILATLVLPLAAAQAIDPVASVNGATSIVRATLLSKVATVRHTIPAGLTPTEARAILQPQPQPDPAPAPAPTRAQDRASKSDGAQPQGDGQQDGALPIGPVTHLLPIPVTGAGAIPRIDIDAILDSAQSLAPLSAPAPAAAPDAPPAPEPIAVASAPVATQAIVATPTATVVAIGVAATAGVAAPAASMLWDRVRRIGLIALLYSRIAKERLLDHGSRERLLDAIRAKPGLAVADLAIATQMPRNTVTYHLRVLEREALVSSTRNGRNRLFFAPGALPQRQNADALATLRHETTLAVAKAIGASPGVDQKALCTRVGISPSLAHWHADRLVASGLVDKRREGRFVRYYPGASFDIVAARSA